MTSELVTNRAPDILEVISDLSSDEVFTPPRIVNEILDLLPPQLWSDPNLRWLDPGCKTGVFLREITRRLMSGLKEVIPDEQKRLQHIIRDQVFGIAITELTSLMSRRTLYCSKDASGKHSVVQTPSNFGNIWFQQVEHSYKDGKCQECKASKSEMERDNRDNHAYAFIHKTGWEAVCKEFGMKFDVIIGNPPYQMKDGGGSGTSAVPLYQLFVEQAKQLNPRYISMIIPSRWYSGGKGLDLFRSTMLNDAQIRRLVDYSSSNELFPGVDIAGGVCYFLWEQGSLGPCQVTHFSNRPVHKSLRFLNEFKSFIRSGEALEVITKIRARKEPTLDALVSSRRPFGLDSKVRPTKDGDLQLIWSGGEGPFRSTLITNGFDIVELYKVMVSKASYDHAGQQDKDGTRRVFGRIAVMSPKVVCTETYLTVGAYSSQAEAENLLSYMKTKFVRFLVSTVLLTQNITRDKFAFVPLVDVSKPWTDKELFTRYNLTLSEQKLIESTIKEMA